MSASATEMQHVPIGTFAAKHPFRYPYLVLKFIVLALIIIAEWIAIIISYIKEVT